MNYASVCDGVFDCLDKSDELNCKMAEISPEYLKEVPPINTDLNYLPLKLNINVESVLDVNAVGSTIQVQLQINLTWSEQRLQFTNIAEDEEINFLPEELMNALWMPTVFFENTKNKLTASFGGGNATGTISLKSGAIGYRNELFELQNKVKYRGKDW